MRAFNMPFIGAPLLPAGFGHYSLLCLPQELLPLFGTAVPSIRNAVKWRFALDETAPSCVGIRPSCGRLVGLPFHAR
jgi:hypothetical protein